MSTVPFLFCLSAGLSGLLLAVTSQLKASEIMAISRYQLKKQIEACYAARGKQRPSPAEEDRDLRRAWERRLAEQEAIEAAAAAVEAAADQAEDDEFWREQLGEPGE